MLIDPRHLHILSAIVDAGGLSEGALALGKSQPSLSRIVSTLEARLGEALFEKGRRPLRPTELCERLAAEGRKIGQASETASIVAQRFTSGQAGTVRIGGTPIFMDGVVSSVIASFQTAHPEVRVDQSYGYTGDLIDQLAVGTIDLGICPMEAIHAPDGFDFVPFLKGRNVIACGAGHPLARKKSLKLEDVSEFPWITQPAGSPLFQDLKDVLTSIGINDFKVSYSGGSLSSILNVLTGSNAITVLPFSVVHMQPGKLITSLPIRIEHPKRELGMLQTSGDAKRPTVRRFVRHLSSEFKSLSQAITDRQRHAVWKA
ncbi:MAG: LysR family transcriptional regulator [Pseudomonadota bacterium]